MATEPLETELAGTCVGPDGSSIGMPQLCFDWWANQIFWLVLALIAIYFILSRVALPRIGAVLAERAGTITNDIAAAEDLREKAKEAEAAYDKALLDARAEAQRIVADAKAEIQADLNAAIAKADAEITAKSAESEKAIADIRASAMENVQIVAKDAAAEIVSALGYKPEDKAVNAAVDARMKG